MRAATAPGNEHGVVEAEAASLVPSPGRLGAREIGTLDCRNFPAMTPKHGGHVTLLPEWS